jgi:hypothetical protein
MGKRVNETLQATVDFHLANNDGAEIFNGRGRHAGLDVHGGVGEATLNYAVVS